jgi:hypothetical protein
MSVVGGNLDDVCAMAADAARAQGHDLGPWEAPPGEEAVARMAACRRCGRVAYVRSESGLAGAAGEVLTERCPADDPAD